ncbi:SPOR domain-containing protein [Sphingobium amiense]
MKRMWESLMVTAMLATAAPALADVKAGVDAWQQGDYARAIAQWRPLAEAGDPDAQFNLGQAYKLGRGVQPDFDAALDWYRKAQRQGHLRAEDNLGLLLFQQGDRDGAMPFLQKSASRGEPRAQYIVATTLFNGDVVGKDWVRAYALMTRASASGLPQATASLGEMDKYIPEDQRQKGLALAAGMERGDKDALASAAAPARAQPKPIRKAELPPSKPAETESSKPAAPKPAPQVAASRPALAPSPSPSPSPAAGGWRVQLGAFGEEARARALWGQLAKNVGGLSAYRSYYEKAGGVTRLQVGPVASAADAARLCGRIKAAGSDCIPKKI